MEVAVQAPVLLPLAAQAELSSEEVSTGAWVPVVAVDFRLLVEPVLPWTLVSMKNKDPV